jgi:hypothetical protein
VVLVPGSAVVLVVEVCVPVVAGRAVLPGAVPVVARVLVAVPVPVAHDRPLPVREVDG